MLWVFALVDLFRTPMSGLAKVLWALAIVFIPILGVILYFIFSPAIKSTKAMEVQPGTDPDDQNIDEVARLHDLNQRGVLDDAEYARYKTYLVR